MRAGALAFVVGALALAGCSSVPVPPMGPHGGEGELRVVVPYAPPPGKVELLPVRPANLKHPVWIDGQWMWTGRRWTWKDGGWEEERYNAYYAPPKTVRISDGTLVHYAGVWKKGDPNEPLASPEPPKPAESQKPADPPKPAEAPKPTEPPKPAEPQTGEH